MTPSPSTYDNRLPSPPPESDWDDLNPWDPEPPPTKKRGCRLRTVLLVIVLVAALLCVVALLIEVSSRRGGVASPRPTRSAAQAMRGVPTLDPTTLRPTETLLPGDVDHDATPTNTQGASSGSGDKVTPMPSPTRKRRKSDPTPVPPNRPEMRSLELYMLELINEDRAEHGLLPVQWDELAAKVALGHAEAMAADGYMSHWDRQGNGPDHRYALAGGTESAMENVAWHSHRWEDGSAYPVEDWPALVRRTQQGLMDSPGHRANILDSHHTHVGVGIAYNEQTGDMMLAQEFINHYISIDQNPGWTRDTDAIVLEGELLDGVKGDLLVNLRYEPPVEPLTVDQLLYEMPHTYAGNSEFVEAYRVDWDERRFSVSIPLDSPGDPGIYHVLFFVEQGDHEPFETSDWMVWLRE